jgi:hypothetical protein
MSYNYSYNVIIDRLKAFADGHFLIRRFTHGSINLSDLPQDGQYPFMHVAPDAFIPVEGGMRFALMVSFFDIPRDKELKAEYQKEALSDCTRLAQDLISEIQANRVLFGPEVSLSNLPEIEPWLEEKKNTVTGVSMLLDIEVPHFWSGCDIPAEYAVGGNSTGGYGSDGVSLILRTNSVDNNVQSILDLVQGANVTITDLGDGRIKIDATGDLGTNWGTIGGVLADQEDLQIVLDTKANEADLAPVAISNDYNDLDNLPTIPDGSTFVPYTGATANVNLGANKYIADDGSDNSEMSPAIFGVQNAAGTKYAYLEKSGLTVQDTGAGDSMNVNAGGLTFPDATSQYSAAVNADWNSTSGLSEILNKPTLPTVIGDMTKAVYDTDDDGVVNFAQAVKAKVRNSTGAVLHKGHIVYLSGSTGNLPNAVYAQANNDANSAQTFGVVYADIANNSDGFVVMLGAIDTLDTRTTAPNPFTSDTLVDGQVIYLSPTTPGHITNVKPTAPDHMVYVGYVIRTSPTNGTIQYRIQNGYELDELHDVQIAAPLAKDLLTYNGNLWQNKAVNSSWLTDATTVGQNLIGLGNPNAIRYLRINADNTVTPVSASQLKTELGGKQFSFKAGDQTSASQSFADVTNLSFAVVAGRTYKFKIFCQFDVTNTSTGTRWAVNGPAFTRLFYSVLWTSGTGTQANMAFQTYDGPASTGASNFTTNNCAIIEGIVIPSASGPFSARFACELTITSVTCKAGSYIQYEEI